jgi:isocitrate/isopropylmalate dehydrogenase
MAQQRIVLMPGDGIGKEVMEAAQLVLDVLDLDAEYQYADVGWKFWCEEGDALPERTIAVLKGATCALFGAITSKPDAEARQELRSDLRDRGLIYRSPILRLRQMFDLYISLRPCVAFPGNPLNYRENIDLIVFRENTEGLYTGIEFHPITDDLLQTMARHHPGMRRFENIPGKEIALSLRVITAKGARRIAKAAFEYAARQGRTKVTLVEKANVLRETSGLMIREARRVAADYPGVELEVTNIDAQMMWLLKQPQDYGVMLTSNLFGDILSDLCAQLVGGLGFTPSGNIGDGFAIFEPSHGSAPKYAGRYVANPIAMILTVAMMLDWLNQTDKAKAVRCAVGEVIAEGRLRTRDMGGSAGTLEIAREVAGRL